MTDHAKIIIPGEVYHRPRSGEIIIMASRLCPEVYYAYSIATCGLEVIDTRNWADGEWVLRGKVEHAVAATLMTAPQEAPHEA